MIDNGRHGAVRTTSETGADKIAVLSFYHESEASGAYGLNTMFGHLACLRRSRRMKTQTHTRTHTLTPVLCYCD